MLSATRPHAGRAPPPTGGARDGSRPPRWSDGWEVRALIAAAGGLYFMAAELAPFDRIDAWIDERFFWEPIAFAVVALLLVLGIERYRQRVWLAGRHSTSSPDGAPSELVPICVRCKAVHDDNDCWEPIEAYLAQRTPDKFTRSLCPACLERLAG